MWVKYLFFLFVIISHYLGRTPLSYCYTDEILEYDKREMDEINVEKDLETEETKQEQNGSIEDEEDLTIKIRLLLWTTLKKIIIYSHSKNLL